MAARWYADDVSRQKVAGEVFTPPDTGWDMLELVITHDPNLIGGSYLDPSCGTGNLLVCVLGMKIEAGIDPHQALESLYGIELMEDNVATCRQRLVQYAVEHGGDPVRCLAIVNSCPDSTYPRIVCHDTFEWDVAYWRPSDVFESEFITFATGIQPAH